LLSEAASLLEDATGNRLPCVQAPRQVVRGEGDLVAAAITRDACNLGDSALFGKSERWQSVIEPLHRLATRSATH
jgi:hypothetical protein